MLYFIMLQWHYNYNGILPVVEISLNLVEIVATFSPTHNSDIY